MAKTYSASDSISTRARMSENRIAGAAPGLRARPSQAAEQALAWAMPQKAEAIAIAKPEVMAIHIAT